MSAAIAELEELAQKIRDQLEAERDNPSDGQPNNFDAEAELRKLEEIERAIEDARANPDTFDADDAGKLLEKLIKLIPRWLPIPDTIKRLLGVMARMLGILFAAAWENAEESSYHNFKQLMRLYGSDTGQTEDEALDRAVREATTPGESYENIRRRFRLRWLLERLDLDSPDQDREEVPLDDSGSHYFPGEPGTFVCGYSLGETPFFLRMVFEPLVAIVSRPRLMVEFRISDPLNVIGNVLLRFDGGDLAFAERRGSGIFCAPVPDRAKRIAAIDYTAAYMGSCITLRFVRRESQQVGQGQVEQTTKGNR